MKTLLKALLILAVAVVLLAAGLVALVMRPTEKKTEAVAFVSAEPVDISSVAVKNETGTYRYYYENDGYVLDDIPASIADLDGFIAFMTHCGKLSALRRVADGPLASYGLETPAATVDLAFFKGNGLHMDVGGKEPVSGNYYVAVQGFPGVYLISEAQAAPFLKPKTQVVSMGVTPPLQVSSPLSAIRDITFAGGGLKEPVTIRATAGGDEAVKRSALSFGTATHLVQSAGLYQLDQTYGAELFGSLFDIRAQDVKAYNVTEQQLKELGFDKPWMTVEYDMVNGAGAKPQHCLLKVAHAGGNAFYAMLDGTGAVFQIAPQPFMGIQFDKLILRWFLTPMLMDVSAVTVEGQGQRYRFDIDNTDAKNPGVTCGETPVNIDLFRSFFRLLTSAASDGAYLGKQEQPEDEALLTVTYEYRANGKAPDVMQMYPGGVRRANVFVNGAGEFAMKDQFITRVWEGCQSLLAGRQIEENW